MSTWPRLQALAAEYGVPVDDDQAGALAHYHQALVEANAVMNLTRIVDEDEAAVKHYVDSLLFLRLIPEELQRKPLRFIDVGAGAGLPGIPLLLMRPHWRGTLLDSVGKKVGFMQEVLQAFGLGESKALHARAEDLARVASHRDGYDMAVARAVAALPELVELTLPFVRKNGRLLVSKGAKGPEELAAAAPALKALQGRLLAQDQVALPDGAGERCLYVIEKCASTPPAYPRKAGTPHKQPIC